MVFIILSGQRVHGPRSHDSKHPSPHSVAIKSPDPTLNSPELPPPVSASLVESQPGREPLTRTGHEEDVNLAQHDFHRSREGDRMSTDLSDPYFCPPRQLRQVQGRLGPAFDSANKGPSSSLSGGLRFRPGPKKRSVEPGAGATRPLPPSPLPISSSGSSSFGQSSLDLSFTRPASSIRRSSSIYESIYTSDSTQDEPFYSIPDSRLSTASTSAMNQHGKSPSWPVSTSDSSSRYEESVVLNQGFHSRDPSWLSSRSEKELDINASTPSLSSKKPSEDSGIALHQFEDETTTHEAECVTRDNSDAAIPHCRHDSQGNESPPPINRNQVPHPNSRDENVWFGSKEQYILLRPGHGSGDSEPGDTVASSPRSNEEIGDENSFGANESSNLYDSDTLRRAAAKNREVSQRLFRQYKEQQQRGSGGSPRTGEGVGGGSGEEERRDDVSRGNPPYLRHEDIHSNNPYANASMRRHSRRRSSLYTESSGSSSGVGTLSSSSTQNEDKEPLTRCSSVETFSGGGAAEGGGGAWNKPQQRRNILSMVETEPGEYLPLKGMKPEENQQECRRSGESETRESGGNNSCGHSASFKTSSSPHYVSHRGVSRKISNRKRVARQEKEESFKHSLQSSLPDLSAPHHPPQVALPVKTSPTSQERPTQPGARLFEGGSIVLRSASPIYAVPCKPRKESDGKGSVMSVRIPPPLPSLPPPTLSQFQYSSSTSTPCLYTELESEPTMLGKAHQVPVAPPRPSKTPSVGLTGTNNFTSSPSSAYSHQVWPQSSQSRRVPLSEPQSASPGLPPLPSKIHPVTKPTVQVHPMCMDVPTDQKDTSLSIKVEAQNGNVHPSTPEKRNGSRAGPVPSPRPPVPKKPDFLSPLKHQQSKMTSRQLPNDASTNNNIHHHNSVQFRQPQQNSQNVSSGFERKEESPENSPRLSVLVKMGDDRLRQILHPPPIPSSTQSSSNNTFGSQGENLDAHSKTQDTKQEADTAYVSRAKFLVGMYARGPSPVPANFLPDSSDQDLEQKKWSLINSLTRKMKILEEEGTAIREEMSVNNKLGEGIFEMLQRSHISDPEYSKVLRLAQDTENVTSLVLKLSGQIARVENGIQKLGTGASTSEKKLLMDRKTRLLEQMEEANHLRVNLDRRSDQVDDILLRHLDSEAAADMKYYLQMKIKLHTDAKEIDDKLKLGKDQKEALEMTLPPPISSS